MVDRRQGWWGIGFAVMLLVAGGMVSIPTADDPGATIVAFYSDHGAVVIAAQVVGALALAPFVMFASALARRALPRTRAPRIVGATTLVVLTELATAVPPLVLALGTPTRSMAHTWTFVADLTDAALFVALGLFALATVPRRPDWVRWFGIAVSLMVFVRAVLSPLGSAALDVVAPIAFIAYVVALGVLMLREHPVEERTR
ncbi:MAG: hypothetical protein WB297_07865 [Actinomycetota bacterium]